MKLTFFADGEPAPGGSKTAIPMYDKDGKLITKPIANSKRERPVLRYVDDAKGNAAWRKVVGWRAKAAMQRERFRLFAGPLRLTCEFVLERGKTVTRPEHTTPPDLTKLIRSTEDAMTKIVWLDDSQIIEHGPMKKRYASPGEPTGAFITVEALNEAPELDLMAAAPSPPAKIEEDSPFD